MKHRNCIDQPCTWGGWEGTQHQGDRSAPQRSGAGEMVHSFTGCIPGEVGWYSQLGGVSLPEANPIAH